MATKIAKVCSKSAKYKINPVKITTYFQNLAKEVKFRQVWSHWRWYSRVQFLGVVT